MFLVPSHLLMQGQITQHQGTGPSAIRTLEQLARKRARDRESQRATRARTKHRIAMLESEVQKLRIQVEGQRTVTELARSNKAMEAEVAFLRQSLALACNGWSYTPFNNIEYAETHIQKPCNNMYASHGEPLGCQAGQIRNAFAVEAMRSSPGSFSVIYGESEQEFTSSANVIERWSNIK